MHSPAFPFEFLQSFYLFINLSEVAAGHVRQYLLRNLFNELKIHINHNML